MKKRFIILFLQLILIPQVLFAYEYDEFFGIEKVLIMRNDIQNQLNLTEAQQIAKDKINSKYHPIFNKKFAELGDKVNELQKLANSSNCTKEKVDKIVNDYKIKENELFEINKNYEKEIKSNLTTTQKIKYSYLKYQGKRQLKKQLNLYIKSAKGQVKPEIYAKQEV